MICPIHHFKEEPSNSHPPICVCVRRERATSILSPLSKTTKDCMCTVETYPERLRVIASHLFMYV